MTAAPEQIAHRKELTVRVEHEELDLLMFSFMQELIYYKDAHRRCLLVDVKAVTLHRFQVAFVDNLWQAVVVLDV